VATLSGVVLAGLGAGTHAGVVTATFAGDGGLEASAGSGDLVVGKAPQTVSFTSTPPESAALGGSYRVTASATSGLPVGFSSDTPETCTVSEGTASFIAVGTCTLRASQVGDANHEAAEAVTQTFSVGPAAPLVSLYTLDFGTFSVGSVVSSAGLGDGMASDTGSSGDRVRIFAKRSGYARDRNRAMVATEGRGLIISKDGRSDNPQSNPRGGVIDVKFSAFETGRVTLKSLRVSGTTTTGGTV